MIAYRRLAFGEKKVFFRVGGPEFRLMLLPLYDMVYLVNQLGLVEELAGSGLYRFIGLVSAISSTLH
jgi:hypothetical protein